MSYLQRTLSARVCLASPSVLAAAQTYSPLSSLPTEPTTSLWSLDTLPRLPCKYVHIHPCLPCKYVRYIHTSTYRYDSRSIEGTAPWDFIKYLTRWGRFIMSYLFCEDICTLWLLSAEYKIRQLIFCQGNPLNCKQIFEWCEYINICVFSVAVFCASTYIHIHPQVL